MAVRDLYIDYLYCRSIGDWATIDKYVAPVSVKISLSNQLLYFEHTNYKKWEGKVVDILLYF